MKKILFLVSLSLFMGLSLHAEEVDVPTLCKEQREKVNELISKISKLKEPSLRNSFHQCWIIPVQDAIDNQLTSGKISDDDYLTFYLDYYVLGDLIVCQRIDQKIQDYKKVYDKMTALQKSHSINPYEPIMRKKGDSWDYDPAALNFYFPQQKNIEPKYTIADLHNYLQTFVNYIKCSKTEEAIKFTDKLEKFFYDNNLWRYEAEELADIIIKDILEFYQAKNTWSEFWSSYANSRKLCNISLSYAIAPDEVNKFALFCIEDAVHALSIKKYDDIMEALQLISAQKGECDTHKAAEKALNDIMQIYANKLLEKAKAVQ